MLPNYSTYEELLRYQSGIEFGKSTHSQFQLISTTKMPHGNLIRKTTITEIVRNGVVIKESITKDLTHVI